MHVYIEKQCRSNVVESKNKLCVNNYGSNKAHKNLLNKYVRFYHGDAVVVTVLQVKHTHEEEEWKE